MNNSHIFTREPRRAANCTWNFFVVIAVVVVESVPKMLLLLAGNGLHCQTCSKLYFQKRCTSLIPVKYEKFFHTFMGEICIFPFMPFCFHKESEKV